MTGVKEPKNAQLLAVIARSLTHHAMTVIGLHAVIELSVGTRRYTASVFSILVARRADSGVSQKLT